MYNVACPKCLPAHPKCSKCPLEKVCEKFLSILTVCEKTEKVHSTLHYAICHSTLSRGIGGEKVSQSNWKDAKLKCGANSSLELRKSLKSNLALGDMIGNFPGYSGQSPSNFDKVFEFRTFRRFRVWKKNFNFAHGVKGKKSTLKGKFPFNPLWRKCAKLNLRKFRFSRMTD
jgi:hypothetical protein